MVKKPNPAAGLFDNALAGSVKDSAQQIWLAGMGAFARAQAEGTKVFEALVKEGATLQQKTQTAAEEKIVDATSRLSTVAGEVQAKAGQQWDRLESIFEDRTAKALAKLGVPSAKDVAALAGRIDALTEKVAALEAAAKKPVKKAPAKRPAVKKAAKGGVARKTA